MLLNVSHAIGEPVHDYFFMYLNLYIKFELKQSINWAI